MHQRKGKKILIYFFLLFFVGSIQNIELNNLRFNEIKNINVSGLGNYDDLILLQEIENLNLINIFLIDKSEISKKINLNNLVEKYEVFKRYPSSLDIKIKKTKFLAKINDNGKIFLVGSNGKLSENNFHNNQLPFIFGNPKIQEFLDFKKNIEQSKFSYDEIENLYFFPSKRWDLELKNNITIKLSKDYVKESLELAFDFLHNNNFRDIKIIDVRIKNQIILND